VNSRPFEAFQWRRIYWYLGREEKRERKKKRGMRES